MTIIFFTLGLIIGSFLNAVAYRLNTLESLWERSHCPYCKKKIRWFDNIPLLSFIILSAKCRDCGEKISWQYPVVELATGVVFALFGTYFFVMSDAISWLTTAYYMAEFALLMIIFIYDLKYMEIPMVILWIGVILAIIYMLIIDWNQFGLVNNFLSLNIASGIVAGIAVFLFFFILAAVSKETWMGMGDAYLGLLVGLIVGWPGVLLALLFSFSVGAILSMILVFLRKKTVKSQVPFAPFLVIGVFLAIILPRIFTQFDFILFLV